MRLLAASACATIVLFAINEGAVNYGREPDAREGIGRPLFNFTQLLIAASELSSADQ